MDYKNSKIYKIVNDENDNFYIGSTCSTLTKRMYIHKSKNNNCMSKKIGVDLKECKIILVEAFECKNKDELLMKEREYIEKYKKEGLNIVNKNRPIISEKERLELTNKLSKQNYKKHRGKKLKYNKEYNKNNAIKISNRCKEYRKKNLEKLTNYNQEYYKKNKELLNKKKREKINCVCGCIVNKNSLLTHIKTKKHKLLMEKKE